MDVTSLTWNQEQSLRKLLGNTSLSLRKSILHPKRMTLSYSIQESILTVISLRGYTIVVLMVEPCTRFATRIANTSLCIIFEKEEMSTFFFNELELHNTHLELYSSRGLALIIEPSQKRCRNNFLIKDSGFYFEHEFDNMECKIFCVEGIKKDPNFIKKIAIVRKRREELLAATRAYTPYRDLVSEIRILLVGPVGSGKSSFFNSVKSVIQGRVSRQAIAGSDESSITEQFRTYSFKDDTSGKPLRFMLCDTMGLDEREKQGLHLDDIPHILKGCVPDRYQFNPDKPITPKHPMYVASPSLKDRIHCVVYVLDINSVNTLSSKMVAKLKQIHKEVLDGDVAHVALLTKVNDCAEALGSDLLNMAPSVTSQKQVMSIRQMLGIPLSHILVVGNYSLERELEPMKDVLILSVLRQMLRATDSFLEDLSPEDTVSTNVCRNQSDFKPKCIS